ncbi:hypothetical protein TorRG33x02_062320 [Trema orientale]|uniref:RNase H type-1 domain-containing protein n=1 Tax=Trema orientale TaxID=63057 RepID=A0A2P5FJF9_TREOI|nr:hypothetical protein TorRG33x02_062320 [Trema orientale]
MNTDASIRNEIGLVCLGAVFRDCKRIVVACLSKQVPGIFSSKTVELLSMRDGLRFGTWLGFQITHVESYALWVINSLKRSIAFANNALLYADI